MLTIDYIKGDSYESGKNKELRNDYIRIVWSRGYIVMRKDAWDKLPKYKRDRIYSMGAKSIL